MSDDESMSYRHCHAVNRAGDPCRAAPLTGSQWCSAHDPQLPAASRFGSTVQASEAATGVQRRTPSVAEKLRQRVEAEADAVLAPFFQALGAGADVELRMRAASALLDRVYGRPRQATELVAAEREIRLAESTAATLAGVLADFARRLGHSPDDAAVREAGRAALQVVAGSGELAARRSSNASRAAA